MRTNPQKTADLLTFTKEIPHANSVRMREIIAQKNSENGHFLRCGKALCSQMYELNYIFLRCITHDE